MVAGGNTEMLTLFAVPLIGFLTIAGITLFDWAEGR